MSKLPDLRTFKKGPERESERSRRIQVKQDESAKRKAEYKARLSAIANANKGQHLNAGKLRHLLSTLPNAPQLPVVQPIPIRVPNINLVNERQFNFKDDSNVNEVVFNLNPYNAIQNNNKLGNFDRDYQIHIGNTIEKIKEVLTNNVNGKVKIGILYTGYFIQSRDAEEGENVNDNSRYFCKRFY